MPFVGKCCFVFDLKDASIIIGFVSTGVSFAGLLSAMLNVFNLLQVPKNALCIWMLEMVFYVGMHGVAFHAVFLLVSLLLVWGAMKDVPPLLTPWVGWCPFIVIGMIASICLSLEKNSKYAAELIGSATIIFIFVLYSSVIVTAHFQQLCQLERQRMYASDMAGLPSPPQYATYFPAGFSSSTPSPSSDPREPRPPDKTSMRERLSWSYARLLMAASQHAQPRPQPV